MHKTTFSLAVALILCAGCATAPTAIPQTEPPPTPTDPPTLEPTLAPTATATTAYPASPEAEFYFGVDLSYVNEMEDCGAVYHVDGEAQDAYTLFQTHGANLVRARLWHDATWTDYSDVADVTETFARARLAGMATLLDFHYSDTWADPGAQEIPAAWEDIEDEDELAQAVYDYTYETLIGLAEANLMPDFVQVGNETNSGILKEGTDQDWPRDAKLFNAGIKAVRDAAQATNTSPEIILHVAQPENTGWWFRQAQAHDLTDFDVIGVSYYPQWSSMSIADMGSHVTYLRQTFGKQVMVMETAYPWTREAVNETADNILTQGVRQYPVSTSGQRQFMIDLTQSLISNGAIGVVYWEPAWISTECSTRWGQGSHWENATFFDFQHDNEVHEGIDFLSFPYTRPLALIDGVIDDAYGDPLITDPSGDNLNGDPALDLVSLSASADGGSILLALEIAGNIFVEAGSNYLIYIDTTQDTAGAPIDVGKRPITAAAPYLPEFRLDISIADQNDTITASRILNAWDGQEWQEITTTGGMAVQIGETSVIEIQIPASQLGLPPAINIAVVSTDKARIHTAFDILGIDTSPAAWDEPVIVDQFFSFPLSD